ncbi:MAG: tetratricopeptide repeat protein [Candidatus Nanopelagicales bacterium]|jgi:tetratricopeptide (TPR) repeat protein|nr:tetratricopeptide repeat protein [Candidatus Nanopelagicales bacterium]
MDDDDLTPDEASEDELWEMLDEATGVDRARILHELGGRAFSEQEFEQSVALAESAAVQARESGDALLTARSLFGQAAGLRRLGRTKELITVAMEAADLLRANGEPAEIAECHAMVAAALADLGDDLAALEHWRSAARLFESEEHPGEAGRMYMSLGEALGRLNRQAEALETFDHARGLFRGSDEPGAVPWADDRAAAALIDLGRIDEALERLRAALSVREVQRDVPRIAYAHYRLGWTLRLVGQFEEALSNLSVAAELFDELEELEGRARCDLEAANALTSLGQHEEAEELYRRTRAVFDALGHDSQVVLSDANRAVLLARIGRVAEAAELNRRLVDQARAGEMTWLLGDIANHLARNLIDLDRPDEALAVLDAQDPASTETAALVQSAALRARALLATGRRAMAARAAEDGLRLAADAEMVAERAELYEMRSLSRLTSRSAPRVAAAERDLAHAVALYLAAGLTERARELSTRFLPRPGIAVHRGGGFLTEQPTLPMPESKPEAPEPRGVGGGAEPRND